MNDTFSVIFHLPD